MELIDKPSEKAKSQKQLAHECKSELRETFKLISSNLDLFNNHDLRTIQKYLKPLEEIVDAEQKRNLENKIADDALKGTL